MANDQREWQRIVAEAWADEDFKRRLTADTKSVLAERGIHVEEGVEVKVVEGSERVRYLVLPPKPAGEYDKEVLDRYSAQLTTRLALLTTHQTNSG
jgi:hypothetical protein